MSSDRVKFGMSWAIKVGWQPYVRMEGEFYFLTPANARACGADITNHSAAAMLGYLADECDRRNREGVAPPGAAELLRTEGQA